MAKGEGIFDIDDTVKHYFNLIEKSKPLSKEQEHKLLLDYRKNKNIEARNKLIVANLKFACSIASTYRGRGVCFGDLISEANDGLIESIDKFDTSRDIKLYSYSVWWIRQRIQAAIDKVKKMPKSELPPEEDNDTQFERDDIFNESFSGKTKEIEPQFIEEEEKTEEKKSRRKFLRDVFKVLNIREKDMLFMYYGIYGYTYKLEDIGHKYKLTKERVRQIIECSLKKTRCRAMVIENKYL